MTQLELIALLATQFSELALDALALSIPDGVTDRVYVTVKTRLGLIESTIYLKDDSLAPEGLKVWTTVTATGTFPYSIWDYEVQRWNSILRILNSLQKAAEQ